MLGSCILWRVFGIPLNRCNSLGTFSYEMAKAVSPIALSYLGFFIPVFYEIKCEISTSKGKPRRNSYYICSLEVLAQKSKDIVFEVLGS